jgi:hypothetical protein
MAELVLEHRFDPQRKRHYLNNEVAVLHCHHYATLFAQLAFDAHDLADGTKLLRETGQEVFGGLLTAYYQKQNITNPEERLDVARRMFSTFGLGLMKPLTLTPQGGEVELVHSHVDEGWIKKWGQIDHPVNLMGAGYIAGMLAATFGGSPDKYKVTETQSIVTGAKTSKFKVSV